MIKNKAYSGLFYAKQFDLCVAEEASRIKSELTAK
jgi:hypothetical protein